MCVHKRRLCDTSSAVVARERDTRYTHEIAELLIVTRCARIANPRYRIGCIRSINVSIIVYRVIIAVTSNETLVNIMDDFLFRDPLSALFISQRKAYIPDGRTAADESHCLTLNGISKHMRRRRRRRRRKYERSEYNAPESRASAPVFQYVLRRAKQCFNSSEFFGHGNSTTACVTATRP